MKKLVLFSFLAAFFTLAFCGDAIAQKKGKKKKSSSKKEKTDEYFDESGFLNKLWYGGGVILGYNGNELQSQFSFGLSPMVGYKLIGDIFSAGPKAGFEYNHIRFRECPSKTCPLYKASPLSYSLGVFARVKPWNNFFGHFEYERQYEDSADPDGDGLITVNTQTGKILTQRVPFDNVYIGGGYNSGGLWAYEIMLLYNVNLPSNTIASPLDIRIGFTHKF